MLSELESANQGNQMHSVDHTSQSQAEIKKAHQWESLIHHPNKGGDEEQFKLVVKAHAMLSDST